MMLRWTREFAAALDLALEEPLNTRALVDLATELALARGPAALRHAHNYDAWPVVVSAIPMQLVARFRESGNHSDVCLSLSICGLMPAHRRDAQTIVEVVVEPRNTRAAGPLSSSVADIRSTVRDAVGLSYTLPRF